MQMVYREKSSCFPDTKFPSLSPLQCPPHPSNPCDIQKYVPQIDRHTSKAQTAAHCRDASIPDFFQKVTSSSSVDCLQVPSPSRALHACWERPVLRGCSITFCFLPLLNNAARTPLCTLKDGFFIFTGLGRNALGQREETIGLFSVKQNHSPTGMSSLPCFALPCNETHSVR